MLSGNLRIIKVNAFQYYILIISKAIAPEAKRRKEFGDEKKAVGHATKNKCSFVRLFFSSIPYRLYTTRLIFIEGNYLLISVIELI